jgi:hypothetical protein
MKLSVINNFLTYKFKINKNELQLKCLKFLFDKKT